MLQSVDVHMYVCICIQTYTYLYTHAHNFQGQNLEIFTFHHLRSDALNLNPNGKFLLSTQSRDVSSNEYG